MKEKQVLQDIYNNLTDENKTVINLVAKGMQVAQNNTVNEITNFINKEEK